MHKLSTFPSSQINNKLVISNNDCYFYYYSKCTKGKSCTFRHEPLALGCEVECSDWLKNGLCVKPHCFYRHMNIEKDRSQIPCFWESQVTGCQKLHCPFMHKNKGLMTSSKCTSECQTDSVTSLAKIATDENDLSSRFIQNHSNSISTLLKKPFSQKKLSHELTSIHQMISAAKKDSSKETVVNHLKDKLEDQENPSNKKKNEENVTANSLTEAKHEKAEKRKITESDMGEDQKVLKVSFSDAPKVSNSHMYTKRRIILDKGKSALMEQKKLISSDVSNHESFVTKRKVVKIDDPVAKNDSNIKKLVFGEKVKICGKNNSLTQNEREFTSSNVKERKCISNVTTTLNEPKVHTKLTVFRMKKEESRQCESPQKMNTFLIEPLTKTIPNNSSFFKPKTTPSKASLTPSPSFKDNQKAIEQGNKSPTCLKKFSAGIISASIIKHNSLNNSNDTLEKIIVKSFEQIMEEKKKKKLSTTKNSQKLCTSNVSCKNFAKEIIHQKSSPKPISIDKISLNEKDSQAICDTSVTLAPDTRRTLDCSKFTKSVPSSIVMKSDKLAKEDSKTGKLTEKDSKTHKLSECEFKSDKTSVIESKCDKFLKNDLKNISTFDVKTVKQSVSKISRQTHDSSILDDACFEELGLDVCTSDTVFTGSSSDEDDEMLFKEMDMLLS